MKKVILTTLLIGLFAIGSAGQASAAYVNLVPGDDDITAVIGSVPASTLVASLTVPYAFEDIGGILYQQVRRADSDGNLIFVYWLANGSGKDALTRLTTWSFTDYQTLVAHESGSVAPVLYDRSANGKNIGFDFPSIGGLPAGQNSVKMWIKTDAGGYKMYGSSVQNGGSDNVLTFAPVPEPTSMLLLGFGLMGLAGGKIRKRFKV